MSVGSVLSKLSRLASLRKDVTAQVELVAASGQLAFMQRRIFNDGVATDGQLITSKVAKKEVGVYGKSHGKRRKAKGFQVSKVDLSFNGDHRRSIQIGRLEGRTVIGFVDLRNRNIANGHQRYRDKEIYNATEEEIERIKRTFATEGRRALQRLLR